MLACLVQGCGPIVTGFRFKAVIVCECSLCNLSSVLWVDNCYTSIARANLKSLGVVLYLQVRICNDMQLMLSRVEKELVGISVQFVFVFVGVGDWSAVIALVNLIVCVCCVRPVRVCGSVTTWT